MLTKHNYKELGTTWDETRIKDCCQQSTPGTPCTECCYDTWKAELQQVNKQLAQVQEGAAQLQNMVNFLTDRRNRYKTWVDELKSAEDKARSICHQLEIIASQSEKIWYNSCKALEAIEVLFCMLKDFYTQVDYLKTRFDELQNCINHNHDASLVKGKGLLKCLDDYGAKLDLVIKTRDAIIVAIINALKIAYQIEDNISTRDCPCDDTPYDPCNPGLPCNCDDTTGTVVYGFKTIICEWFCDFGCDQECVPCDDNQKPPASKSTGTGSSGSDCPEGPCELEPVLDLPICNDPYSCCVQKWYDADDQKVKQLSIKLRDANKQKEALQACKQSLITAIQQVDPSTRCN